MVKLDEKKALTLHALLDLFLQLLLEPFLLLVLLPPPFLLLLLLLLNLSSNLLVHFLAFPLFPFAILFIFEGKNGKIETSFQICLEKNKFKR